MSARERQAKARELREQVEGMREQAWGVALQNAELIKMLVEVRGLLTQVYVDNERLQRERNEQAQRAGVAEAVCMLLAQWSDLDEQALAEDRAEAAEKWEAMRDALNFWRASALPVEGQEKGKLG